MAYHIVFFERRWNGQTHSVGDAQYVNINSFATRKAAYAEATRACDNVNKHRDTDDFDSTLEFRIAED